MDFFEYRQNHLYAEDVAVSEIAAEYGTPAYVYSRKTIERHWHAFDDALGNHPHLICYAVKANSNLAVLNLMARMGSGFDIVSAGELKRVLRAGGRADRVVFSGVGKREDEILFALEAGIRCFNCESPPELERINRIAGEAGLIAPVSLRVNPDVDAKTHPYISTGLKENKFGIDIQNAPNVYQEAAHLPNVQIMGIDCHIGSQLTSLDPFIDALDRVLQLAETLKEQGISIKHLDLGGGLGVHYRDENPPQPAEYAAALLEKLSDTDYEILLEPGRAIMANAGILLMTVEYLKLGPHKNFAIVDAAMNDNMRPALYSAWQHIGPIELLDDIEPKTYDIVGPVCETGDFLGKDRDLALSEGDLLVMRSAGAYGYSMSSNYNTRPRPVELMIDGDRVHVIHKRETFEQMIEGEQVLPED
jgi:diaminopimelate decarboxylase